MCVGFGQKYIGPRGNQQSNSHQIVELVAVTSVGMPLVQSRLQPIMR